MTGPNPNNKTAYYIKRKGYNIQEIIFLAAQVSAQTVIEELKNRSVMRMDRRLRNTKLLLRNLRNFHEHIKNIKEIDEGIENIDAAELLDSIEANEECNEDTYIQAIKRTKQRTRIICEHIETFLNFLRCKYENNEDNAKRRKWTVLQSHYLDENKKSISELADSLYCHERTINRDKDEIVKELAVLLFGVDGLKFL